MYVARGLTGGARRIAAGAVGAGKQKRVGTWSHPLLRLGMGVLWAAAMAAGAQGQTAAGAQQAGAATAGTMVEARSCAACHAAEVKGFADNPHARAAGGGMTCAGCHGIAKEHIASGGDTSKIFAPSQATAQQVDAMCLKCHQAKEANFERSAHGKGEVSCVSCHRIHGGEGKDLLAAAEPGLCYQCHAGVKPQFGMPFHHPVDEGTMACSACHDPHGRPDQRLAGSIAQQNRVCTKCHTQMAGPFVYEHAAVTSEGCTACHVPHGGEHPHLLLKAKVDTMCELCHKPAPNFLTGVHVRTALDKSAPAPPCTACHSQIHGSNESALFLIKNKQ